MSDKKRREILSKMETIIGNSCYNGSIQNWGSGGQWYGEGREFRYPIKFVRNNGEAEKRWSTDPAMPLTEMRSGYYPFGANQLHIIRALEGVLTYLENEHGFKITEAEMPIKSKCPHCSKLVANIDQHISQAHPDLWDTYTESPAVKLRIGDKVRCVNCGSFLKSLDGHGAKCPNTFQTRNSEPSNSNQEKFKPRGKIKITECPVCGNNSGNRRKLDAHLLKMHSMVMDKYGSVMDANNHPSTSKIYSTKNKGMFRTTQGGSPGPGKRK